LLGYRSTVTDGDAEVVVMTIGDVLLGFVTTGIADIVVGEVEVVGDVEDEGVEEEVEDEEEFLRVVFMNLMYFSLRSLTSDSDITTVHNSMRFTKVFESKSTELAASHSLMNALMLI